MMLRSIALATLTAMLVGLVGAQGPAAKPGDGAASRSAGVAPASAPAGDKLTVKVVSVKGIVQKRQAGDADGKWQAVAVGDELSEMTVLRTGLGSEAVLGFTDRTQVIVRAGTKVGIQEYRKQKDAIQTSLGVKYGLLQADVDSSKRPNRFNVATPVATLSVKGTGGKIAFWGDNGLYLQGTHGIWWVSSTGVIREVMAGEWNNGNQDTNTALALMWREVIMGDPSGGMTLTELQNYIQNGGGRGVFDFTGGLNQLILNTITPSGGSSTSQPTGNSYMPLY